MLTGMFTYVRLQTVHPSKPLSTDSTMIPLYSNVDTHMIFQMTRVHKFLIADNTLMWTFWSVDMQMPFQKMQICKFLTADITLIWMFSRVDMHMGFQVHKCLSADITTMSGLASTRASTRHTIATESPNTITVSRFLAVVAWTFSCTVRCTHVDVTVNVCSWNFFFNCTFLTLTTAVTVNWATVHWMMVIVAWKFNCTKRSNCTTRCTCANVTVNVCTRNISICSWKFIFNCTVLTTTTAVTANWATVHQIVVAAAWKFSCTNRCTRADVIVIVHSWNFAFNYQFLHVLARPCTFWMEQSQTQNMYFNSRHANWRHK